MHLPVIPREYSKAIVKSCLLLSGNLPLLLSNRGQNSFSLFRRDDDDDDDDEVEGAKFWVFMAISVTLVLLGGIFAGLTLGLMGQDEVYLQVVEQTGSPSERKNAGKVLKLLKKGKHWVLVTMLLSNVITNETLPIVLDRCLGGGWPAVVSSSGLIVIFGEVIPQSVSVRYGLGIGATFAPFVLVLMYIMYPIAYPTALLLDHVLGEDHGTVYRKAQLKTLVSLHKSMGADRLNNDEVTIISAVLDLNEKPIGSIMTPIQDVYTMSADRILDEATVEEILKAGYSRIPIHTPNEPYNFIGMLLVRILISYDPEDAQPVSTFPLATLPETKPDTTCLNVLNYFQEGKSHMMLVSEAPGEAYGSLGVVTLEDVIEELIGEEIVDESDVFVDISQGIRRKYASPMTRRTLPSQFVAQHQHNPNADISSSATSSQVALTSQTQGVVSGATNNVPRTSMGNAPGPKMEPLNLAIRPKETTNAKVTIKRGAMEDYVRRASLDARLSLTSTPITLAQNGAKYGLPQDGAEYGKIHDSERAALLDGPPTAEVHPSSYSKPSKSSRSDRRPSSLIEMDALKGKISLEEARDYYDQQRSSGNPPITPGSASEPESATSTTRLLDDPDRAQQEFHANGIIESVREVHGFQKTIIESAPMSDDSSDTDDSESDSEDGSQGSHSSGGPILDLERGQSETDHHKKKKKKKTTRSESNSSQKKGLFRSGSIFSERGFRRLSNGNNES